MDKGIDVNVSVSGGGGSSGSSKTTGSGGGGGGGGTVTVHGSNGVSTTISKSDSDGIKAAQKEYNDAKAKGDTAGMAAAHQKAESIRNNNGYSGGTDGSRVDKKAKGGVNLRGNVYNVDEKGPELLIEPDEGRFVRIRNGGNVIPADVSKKLWEFGANPKAFLKDIMAQNIVKINPQIVSMAVPAGFSTGNITENHYNIQSLELHDIHDMNAFIKELPNLPNLAKQWATSQ